MIARSQFSRAFSRHHDFRALRRSAFTLVELLASMGVLSFLMLILVSVTDSATRAWRGSQSRSDVFQSARTSLELVSRELTPAVVDTRMQFVVGPGSILADAGAKNVVQKAPVALWMAPLGDDGSLRCVGYYLYRDAARGFYRLKRIYIAPTLADGKTISPYFPKMLNPSNPRDTEVQTSAEHEKWFTRHWDEVAFDEEDKNNNQAVVSSAADGVVAFWVQCLDVLNNPIVPLSSKSTASYANKHPESVLHYNSAAYFQVATTSAFENGTSFQYLAKTDQSMKANRVPAAIDLTVVIIDNATITRGFPVPEQTDDCNVAVKSGTFKGALDVEASVKKYSDKLIENKIYNARTFTTRVKLVNGI